MQLPIWPIEYFNVLLAYKAIVYHDHRHTFWIFAIKCIANTVIKHIIACVTSGFRLQNCSGRVEDSIILLSSDNKSSDINDIDESSSNFQNQNAVESVQIRAT